MKKIRKIKENLYSQKNGTKEFAKASPYEEEVYREVNSRSFRHSFAVLIQNYKKQIELNPPKASIT